MSVPRVTAILLGYGDEPWLKQAVQAVLDSTGVDVDVVLVDNGADPGAVNAVRDLPRVRVIRPGSNTGYAGGCRVGAEAATGDYLAFVNSDAIVDPPALARIVAVAAEPRVGAAMGSIRLAASPDLINTAGNPLHFAGLSWAGGNGEPATGYPVRRSVPSVSGCCFAARREVWDRLDGFAAEYFAYHEDTELSLRLWQRGLTVEYVPDAVVVHHYEFSRNDLKFYLLERNRLITLLTTYQARSLAVLAPALLLTEAAMVAAALAGGWLRPKVRGWGWLWRQRRWLGERRRLLQRERTVPDRVIAELMTARFDPTNIAAPPGIGIYNAIAAGYWRLARPLLPRRSTLRGR